MNTMRHFVRVLFAVAGLAAMTAAQATYISDNLWHFHSGKDLVTDTYWATASFGTDANTYELTSIVLPAALISGSVSDVVLELYDSEGAGPGAPGTRIGALVAPDSLPGTKTEVSFSSSGIVLQPSSTYWVVARSLDGATTFHWYWTSSTDGEGVGFQHTWGYSDDAGANWHTFDDEPMQMRVEGVVMASWSDLGFALPGVAGEPRLEGVGSLVAGSAGSLQLTSAAPLAPALLFVSVDSTPTPFKGGTLATVPVLQVMPVATQALGTADLSWGAWPAGLSGLNLYLQCAIQDAAAQKGVALSNALHAHVP